MERTLINFDDQATKRRMLTLIGALKGQQWVEIRKFRRGRTLAQNSWYWACIVPAAGQWMREMGNDVTDAQAHEVMAERFLGIDVKNEDTGELLGRAVRSTTSLDVTEMVDYCEKCRAWLAESNVIVPDPDPEYWKAA